MTTGTPISVALLAACCLLTAGCHPVPIYARGLLAHPCMQGDQHPDQSRAREHMLGARESSRGAGSTEAGAGCGCN